MQDLQKYQLITLPTGWQLQKRDLLLPLVHGLDSVLLFIISILYTTHSTFCVASAEIVH